MRLHSRKGKKMRTRPTRSKNPELIRKIKRYVDEYNNRYLEMPSTNEIGKALGVNKTTVYRYLMLSSSISKKQRIRNNAFCIG